MKRKIHFPFFELYFNSGKTLTFLAVFTALILFNKNAVAQNCSINAGVNTSICLGETLTLDGNIGGPINSSTLKWSVISQPAGASVLIANVNSLITNAGTSLMSGAYTFQLEAVCGDGIAVQDQVTITVNTVPNTPLQTGTSSFTCYTGGPITLTGTTPGAGESVVWSAGGLGGIFNAQTSSTTNFTPNFPLDECSSSYSINISYTIRNSSGCSKSVTKTYTFNRSYNLTATAEPTPVCGTSTFLKGSCPGAGTAAWTIVSKPAGASDPVLGSSSSSNTSVSGLIPGTYVFRYTVTGGCNAGSVDVTVSVSGGSGVTNANAGIDQHLCTIPGTISLQGNSPAVGETVTWSLLKGGTPVNITDLNSFSTTATGLVDAGAPYNFQYAIINAGGCISKSTVTVYVEPKLTLRNDILNACINASSSGTDQNNVVSLSSFGFNQLDTVKVSVTYVSGPAASIGSTIGGGSSFNGLFVSNNLNIPTGLGQTISRTLWNTGNASSPNELYLTRGVDSISYLYFLRNSFITSTIGTYNLVVTYQTKCSTYVANITINRGITAITVNAGTDILLSCGSTTATLAGNMANGFAYWTTLSKPAGAIDPINVSNFQLKNPVLTGLINGTYIFKYMNNAGPTCFQSSDDVKLVVSSTPPPVPNAGIDQTICAGTITLNGSAIPDGALARWSLVSPSGASVVFTDATNSTTSVSGLLTNTIYTFRYTLSNGCGSNFDDVVITTTSNTGPSKPTLTGTVSNCSYYPIFGPFPKTFSVTLNHDALSGSQTGTVNIVSLPAGALGSWTVTGSTSTSNTVQVTLNNEASVSYIYCVSDATCATQTYCDSLTVFYFNNLSSSTINAGPDQHICSVDSYPYVVNLTGSTANVNKQWSLVYSSNGQGVAFGSPANSSTTVTLPADGTYKFKYQYIGLDPSCPDYADYVNVVVSQPGSLALAGDDITVCNGNGTFNLNATPLASGTGTWSVENIISGANPIITNPTSPTA